VKLHLEALLVPEPQGQMVHLRAGDRVLVAINQDGGVTP